MLIFCLQLFCLENNLFILKIFRQLARPLSAPLYKYYRNLNFVQFIAELHLNPSVFAPSKAPLRAATELPFFKNSPANERTPFRLAQRGKSFGRRKQRKGISRYIRWREGGEAVCVRVERVTGQTGGCRR